MKEPMSQTFMRMIAARFLMAIEREIEVIAEEISRTQIKGQSKMQQRKLRKETIKKLRENGLSLREIGVRYNLSAEGVRKIAK